jgi:hypothetical protein
MIHVRVRSTRLQSDTELTTSSSSQTLQDGLMSSDMEPSTAHANETGNGSMLRFSTVVATDHQCRPFQWTCDAWYPIISR